MNRVKIILKTSALFLYILFLSFNFSSHVFAEARFAKNNAGLKDGKWVEKPTELRKVIKEVLAYAEKGVAYDPNVLHGGKWKGASDIKRTIQTLEFMVKVIDEDEKAGVKSRLTDPSFIEKNFELVLWMPNVEQAKALADKKPLLKQVTDEKILYTKYFVKLAEGSFSKTREKSHPLYGLPFDEADLSLDDANKQKNNLTRFKFGKQSILTGVLSEKKLAPELIWLTREDLEGALLQGTVVTRSEGIQKIYNVHRSNEIDYNRSLKPYEQERYWYFKEVKDILGYGKDANYKVAVLPEVTVAGDLEYFGLGRIFLLNTIENGHSIYRLTILADTGGAFKNNQYQLDWLSGYYNGWNDYHAQNKHIADTCKSWVLLVKSAN